jgi:co-chaperonin GroES (HSP10)
MIKPVGKQLLIKIVKKELDSGIVLPDGVTIEEDLKAVVEDTGSLCELGLEKGNEVLFRGGTQGVKVNDTFHIIPEVAVIAITNYAETVDATLTKDDLLQAKELLDKVDK